MRLKLPIEILLGLIFIISVSSCSKEGNKKQGHYYIETLTNLLDVPVKVEIGRVTKKITGSDLDFTKNLVYRPFANLQPKQVLTIDSTFVCTSNCESILNEGDPEMEPIFLRLTFDNKSKIDTNCRHVYVYSGLIKNCQTEKKNYFNQQYHTVTKDQYGNTINDYIFDNNDLAEAK